MITVLFTSLRWLSQSVETSTQAWETIARKDFVHAKCVRTQTLFKNIALAKQYLLEQDIPSVDTPTVSVNECKSPQSILLTPVMQSDDTTNWPNWNIAYHEYYSLNP